MNNQCIYREDVVIHNENMIGIVIRVAGDSDSDSSISDDGDDKDENGDNSRNDGSDKKNIGNASGKTNSNESLVDGITFFDCDDDMINPLPVDHIRVAWVDGSEATLKLSEVIVTDRRFLHGDFVTSASESTGQIGIVVDVHLCVDLLSSDGFSLKDVSSKDLERVREFAIGDYVVLGTWLGRVDDVLDNVTVMFDDGSVCKVIKADPSQLKPVGSNAMMDVCFPYYPGQHVQASSSVFKSSKWLSGSWKAGKLKGTVINVTAGSLFIYWLSTSGCGQDSLTAPLEEQSPNKILKALSCFSHTNWQLGDRCFLPDFFVNSGLSRAEFDVLLDNGEDCGQDRSSSFVDSVTGKKDMSSVVDTTDVNRECSNAVDSKPSKDLLSSSKESLLQAWSIHRKKLHKSVVRRDKKVPRKEESYECALLIGNIKTTIDVVWQDGKLEYGLAAVGLIPLENPGDHEFVPEQYVIDRGTDENDGNHELRRTGVVRSVNALERTAVVRWLLNPVSSNENSQGFEGEEVVSVYELEGHPDYDYCYGDVVVRLSHSSVSSVEASFVQNSSDHSKLKDDINDVKHHINHIENNNSGPETSMEPILSWIGNVTNLKDGLIEVTWADGVVSMVGPQAVFVVGRDDDESASDESSTDDTDSWETVISDETTSIKTEEQPIEGPSASNGVLSIPMSALGVVAKLATEIFSCGRKDSLSSVNKSRSEFPSNDCEIASGNTPRGEESDLMLESVKTTLSQQNRENEYDHEVMTPNVVQKLKASPPIHHATQVSKFKHFDAANDPVDHYFVGISEQGSAGKQWFKKVQQDWIILQNNLPDGIYVRVYEDRMDLLRVAIVGSCGTPYQDGLFFFDFHLPSGYPNVPPSAHYHSGGWRINPNLYEEGKVCLSLLNTWTGRGNEVWDPLSSSILQVLVSLQGLVLNSKPYFNEAGYDKQIGTAEGEKNSVSYNENTFLLNCKTMTYVMRKPPKDFEDLVREHFKGGGLYILKACDTYMRGYSIGSLSKEGLAGEGSKCNATSVGFKLMLSKIIPKLVISLSQVGVDCEEFKHFSTGSFVCQTEVQP